MMLVAITFGNDGAWVPALPHKLLSYFNDVSCAGGGNWPIRGVDPTEVIGQSEGNKCDVTYRYRIS